MSLLEIKHSDLVVGCRAGETIYLHPRLIRRKKLFRAVLEHELEHSNGFNFKDLILDIKSDELKGLKKDYYKFLLKNPRAIIGTYFPIIKLDGKYTINIQLLLVWIIAISFPILIWNLIFLAY